MQKFRIKMKPLPEILENNSKSRKLQLEHENIIILIKYQHLYQKIEQLYKTIQKCFFSLILYVSMPDNTYKKTVEYHEVSNIYQRYRKRNLDFCLKVAR